MNKNCDDPNFLNNEQNSKPPVGGSGGRSKQKTKKLPTGDPVETLVDSETPSTGGPVTGFSTTGSETGGSGGGGGGGAGGGTGDSGGGAGGSGGGGGAGGGSGQSSPCKEEPEDKQEEYDVDGWVQPKTEHGRNKGKKIKQKHPCGNCGKNAKSEEFKPNTIYPFNKVTQTESGHVIEVDDTPGSERLTLMHRAGSNVEYFPNGDVLKQDVRDSYVQIFRDQYVHLGGYSSVTVNKGLRILINADDEDNKKEEHVNFDIHIAKNANVNIYLEEGNMNISLDKGSINTRLNEGDINIRQDKGNLNHTVAGDYNLEVGGHMHVVVGGNVVNEIGGSRDERIDGDFDQKYLTNSSGYLGEFLLGERREYVAKDKFIQVDQNINEKAQHKKQELQSQEKTIFGSHVTKTGGNWWLVSTAGVAIEGLQTISIKSKLDMDIFGAEYRGKMRVYSGDNLELIGEKFTVLRSATDKVELKTPKDVTLKTPILYKPDDKKAPGFSKDPKPFNGDNPSQYTTVKPILTKSYMQNNKKQWVPTNSKK